MPDQDCAFFGHDASRARWKVEGAPRLTWEQSVAWLTGAALTGGAVKIGEPFVDLDEREVGVLRRLLPSPGRPARPIDLFQPEPPRVWWLPMEGDAGKWDIVAVFNWDESEPDTAVLSFADFDFAPDDYYTVYDFWNERYYGTARESLEVTVSPGSVRLLGLRRYADRPMLIASDRHYTQGAMDHTALHWDAQANTLGGTFTAVADTAYTLRVLIPEPFALENVEATLKGEAVEQSAIRTAHIETADRVRAISFHCAQGGELRWWVRCRANR